MTWNGISWTVPTPGGNVVYSNIANQAVQVLNDPRAQNGDNLLSLTRLSDNSSGVDVEIRRTARAPGDYGTSKCPPLLQAYAEVSTQYTSSRFLWKVSAHEMLHLAGMNHGAFYDAFYPGEEEDDNGTRSETCIGESLMPNYFQASTDDVALLNYLHGNPGNRQLMPDSGFENGYATTSWVMGTGSLTTEGTNPYDGYRRARFTPPSFSDTQSLQKRVRMDTGNGNEQYRVNMQIAPPSSTATTTVRVKMFTRGGNFDPSQDNNCSYEDGLDNRDPNIHPGLTAWSIVQQVDRTLVSGWNNQILTSWYDPPTRDIRDFSIWIQGFANVGGSPGAILLDNMTIEGT